jgi:DNA-binding GntR family transcriptional regulator
MSTGQKAATKRNEKQKSLTDQAYSGLRKEIITCRLRPGTEVGEQELASRLNMSKTPVRESLVRLTLEGLVEAFPRRGYRIKPVTIKDIADIFTVRKALESVAAELAAVRMSKEELDVLKTLADQTYVQDSSLPVLEFVSANNIFHAAIARCHVRDAGRSHTHHRHPLQSRSGSGKRGYFAAHREYAARVAKRADLR